MTYIYIYIYLDIEEFNFQFTLSSTKFDGCRSSIVYSGPAVMSPRLAANPGDATGRW